MASNDSKISALTRATSVDGTEVIPFAKGGANGSVSVSVLMEKAKTTALSGAIADSDDIEGEQDPGDGKWLLTLTDGAKRQPVIDDWLTRCVRRTGNNTVTLGGYDTTTDTFYLGEHDATYTYEQVRTALKLAPATIGALNGIFNGWKRACLPPVYISAAGSVTLNYEFRYSSETAIALAGYYGKLRVSTAPHAFDGCSELKVIVGAITLEATTPSNTVGMFAACPNLETVMIEGLKTDLSFADSPKLTLASLQTLVTKAANTAAITVTVHPTVYSKLTDEANTDWYGVMAAATAKKISFATNA